MINVSAWKPLPKEYVKGQVYTMTYFQDDVYTFGRLMVLPNSSILPHLHDNDCEWYIDEESGVTFFCPKGGSHQFSNSTDNIVYLLSIKKVV